MPVGGHHHRQAEVGHLVLGKDSHQNTGVEILQTRHTQADSSTLEYQLADEGGIVARQNTGDLDWLKPVRPLQWPGSSRKATTAVHDEIVVFEIFGAARFSAALEIRWGRQKPQAHLRNFARYQRRALQTSVG